MKVVVNQPGTDKEMRLIPESPADEGFLNAMLTCLKHEESRILLVTFAILTAGSIEFTASLKK